VKTPNKAPPTTFAVTSRAIVRVIEMKQQNPDREAARAAPAKVVAHPKYEVMKAVVVCMFHVVLLAGCSSVEKQPPPEVKFDKFAVPEVLPPSPSQRRSRGGGIAPGGDLTPRIELVVLKTEGEIDRPPKVRLPILASAVYPRELLRARITGDATVRLTIENDGRVSSVSVVHASQQEFADAIIAKSNRLSFYPAVRSGLPVVSHITCKLAFSLPEE
jgi:TonB family protein